MTSISHTVLNDVSVTVRGDTIEIAAPERYKIVINGKPIAQPPSTGRADEPPKGPR
jgi:hypothetical protein